MGTTHLQTMCISANFPAEDGGCYQALDAVTYQTSFPCSFDVSGFPRTAYLQDRSTDNVYRYISRISCLMYMTT
jgi:hypothetical protein